MNWKKCLRWTRKVFSMLFFVELNTYSYHCEILIYIGTVRGTRVPSHYQKMNWKKNLRRGLKVFSSLNHPVRRASILAHSVRRRRRRSSQLIYRFHSSTFRSLSVAFLRPRILTVLRNFCVFTFCREKHPIFEKNKSRHLLYGWASKACKNGLVKFDLLNLTCKIGVV
jgi:hypothetical protein